MNPIKMHYRPDPAIGADFVRVYAEYTGGHFEPMGTLPIGEVPVEPTPKTQPIENLMSLLAGTSRQEAAAKQTCTWCKKPAAYFRDNLSHKEYTISGFCQQCQDEVFGQEEEEEPTNEKA